MNRALAVALVAGMLTVAAAAQTSPYAGLEGREIKALSPQQIEGYLSGHGMSLALPAELNGYPGPKHVLELAGELHLDAGQAQRVQEIFDAMHREAVDLGGEVVAAEAGLDRLFAGGGATAEVVRQTLDELGRLQAQLRYAHLRAHLETRAALSPQQIERYAQLRGYGGDGEPAHHPGHHHPGPRP